MSIAPRGDGDSRNGPNKPIEAREQVSKCLGRCGEEYSLQVTPGAQSKLIRETAIQDDLPSMQEAPQSHRNERVDGTNAVSQGTGPGGAEG